MDFRRRNINKVQRNGELIAYNYSSSSISFGGGGSSSSSGGNYLPATANGDGTYTVDLSQVTFNGHIVAQGEVSAYGSGSTSGDSTGTTGGGTTSIVIEDNLTSTSTTAALSANQGRILKGLIDNAEVDLSDYYTKSQVDAKLSNVDLSNYYTKAQTTEKLNDKLDKSVWDEAFEFNEDGSLKVKVNLYGDGEISAYGSGSTANTEINLDNYYTKSEIDNKLDNIECTGGTAEVDLSNYYTKAQVNTKLGGYSETSHTHSDYSLTSHTHSDYATTATVNTHTANTTVHITAAERTKWNNAATSSHTHSNKTVLDGISSTKVTNWDKVVTDWSSIFEINADGSLKVKVNLYGQGEISAFGSGETSNDISVDLSNYYTKAQVDDLIDNIDVGDVNVDLSNYYTKAQVNTKLGGYSETSHTHSNYSLTSHTHSQYASSSHSHSNYSLTSHTHSYAAASHTHPISAITSLQSTLDGKSGTGHSHSNYSLTSHSHSNYSLTSHSHSNYSVTSHTHALSALTSTAHTHTTIVGNYTANGGQQPPNYFGKNRVGALMMNTTVNGNSHYKDWLFMDCYSGNDVGGGVAIGVNRQALGAYIMRSASGRTSWAESAELLGTHNWSTYCAAKSHTHSTLTFSAGTFAAKSYNGGSAVTVSVPTHTSHITNNSGFITTAATVTNSDKLDGYHGAFANTRKSLCVALFRWFNCSWYS